jgi:prepilin peptidase dependent protein B
MKKQTGFTLIEIMIALVVGLIVVAATISIYVATTKSSSDTIKATRLNHDLEAVMTMMINDIRRSGYWGGALIEVDSRDNPFTAATTNIQIPTASCILYTYDANNSGANTPNDLTDDVEANEYYGFKLENSSIKMRKTGAANTTTAAAGCNASTDWEEFVDSNQLTITTLQFSFASIATPALPATSRCLNVATGISTDTNAAACAGAATGNNLVQKRVVNIVLAGRLSSDASVTKSLNGTVEIRNNRLLIAP